MRKNNIYKTCTLQNTIQLHKLTKIIKEGKDRWLTIKKKNTTRYQLQNTNDNR